MITSIVAMSSQFNLCSSCIFYADNWDQQDIYQYDLNNI